VNRWNFRRVFAAVTVAIFLAITVVSGGYLVATNGVQQTPSGLTFVKTGGFQTHFQSWGRASSTQIVLIHGAFESTYYFESLANILGKKFHVEAYDIKGFGYTERVAPYTVQSDAAQLHDFLLARKLDHPILVGHSLGAGVIARFALDYPQEAEGVAGYVFLDGDGLSLARPVGGLLKYLPDPYVTATYRFITRSSIIIPAVFKATCGSICAPLTHDQLTQIELPLRQPGAQEALFKLAEAPIPGVSIQELIKLRSQKAPKHVIFGAEDHEFDPETPEEIARYIGAPPPVFIPEAGHLSMWAQPARVASAIQDFVTKRVS
jgi:pimeloyl-ACP methyl ester carboxylesterase